MTDTRLYHDGSRYLQDRFATRKLADRIEEVVAPPRSPTTTAPSSRAARSSSWPPRTARAGPTAPTRAAARLRPRARRETVAFPSYDGNGMFQSLGNVMVNPHVGLLFIDFESPRRMRVSGRASVREDDPCSRSSGGAAHRARARRAIFPNCPRYIHRMQMVEESPYAPCEGHTPPIPEWKTRPVFREVLPPAIPRPPRPDRAARPAPSWPAFS